NPREDKDDAEDHERVKAGLADVRSERETRADGHRARDEHRRDPPSRAPRASNLRAQIVTLRRLERPRLRQSPLETPAVRRRNTNRARGSSKTGATAEIAGTSGLRVPPRAA